jgi:hypothetical protein
MRSIKGRLGRQSARRRTWTSVVILGALAATVISIAGSAWAAGGPAASTTAASNITSTSATLNAIVSPNKTATTYVFQYGKTTSYGSQTASQGPVNGNAGKSVSADVIGLAPSTTYHFRVVAANSIGTANGSDMTFTTAAPGVAPARSVTINSTPHSVTYGRAATIAGQLSGAGNAGVKMTLEANPYPYTGGFKPTTVTATTTPTGAYSFTATPTSNTHYEVMAKTKPPVTSPQTVVTVRVKVSLRLSRRSVAISHRIRFSGTVMPAHNGKVAQIQKRTRAGAWRTVARATLVAAAPVNGTAISKFSKRLRISHKATYRVRVNPKDGDHIVGTSPSRRVRVH